MDLTPLIPKGKQLITGYGNGGFKVNGEFIGGSLLVFPDRVLIWPVTRPEEIDHAALMQALALPDMEPVELSLLGGGKAFLLPDPALRVALKEKGIALDAMDTGAACRTYNVLMAEERRVAAALIAV